MSKGIKFSLVQDKSKVVHQLNSLLTIIIPKANLAKASIKLFG